MGTAAVIRDFSTGRVASRSRPVSTAGKWGGYREAGFVSGGGPEDHGDIVGVRSVASRARSHGREQILPVPVQPGRHLRVAEQACHGGLNHGPREGFFPGEAFKQHQPQGVDIRAGLDRSPLGLFGAEVVGGSDGRSGRRGHGGLDHARNAEISEFGVQAGIVVAAPKHQDIRGLHIPVHHALGVDIGERVCEIGPDLCS